MFSENLFRTKAETDGHLQRQRRVLVRNPANGVDHQKSPEFDAALHAEELVALREGSCVGSDMQEGSIHVAAILDDLRPARRPERARRRLSKRHRRPA